MARWLKARAFEMKFQPLLIVDDNPSNVRLMEAILSSEGYAVKSAMDADEALTLLGTWRPSLILMDIQLPGMDGLELTRRLKCDSRYSQIVIVALTAYAMKGDEAKARAAGCDGYITKPIDTRTLTGVIARYLKMASTGIKSATNKSDVDVAGAKGRRRYDRASDG
jgi:two-component system, cell cycle response regulator DivK